ncbi:MAG TPA: lysophospholipid acyltransferase family protein [Candidatus Acidoferrum sp.]|nr:lysophospholipid acyltransferase family protein [Candidatus Acidoferrum sp.]
MAEVSSKHAKRSPPGKKRKSGVIVPHSAKWYQRFGALALFVLSRVFMVTMRCRMRHPSEFFAPNAPGPAIFCFWHNRLASCIKVYEGLRKPHTSGRGMAALISASRDGAFLVDILEWFGVQPVRGSSSRRGPQALLELTTWAERGYDLTLTPDGPRGPCYQIQEGVTSLAQVTGLPVVPVAFNLNWKVRVKSWDRFQIPLPFARCEVVVGRVMRVPAEATDAEREELRQQLEAELRAITRD